MDQSRHRNWREKQRSDAVSGDRVPLLFVVELLVDRKVVRIGRGLGFNAQRGEVKTIFDNFGCTTDNVGLAASTTDIAIEHWFWFEEGNSLFDVSFVRRFSFCSFFLSFFFLFDK